MAFHGPSRQPESAPKVPIPRLDSRRSLRGNNDTNEPSRVQRACKNCRKRKVKCTATRPSCKSCTEAGVECVYPTSRRDRLASVAEQKGELIQLIKDLRIRVDDADKRKITTVLETIEGDDSYVPSPISLNTAAKRPKVHSRPEDQEDSDSGASGWNMIIGTDALRKRQHPQDSADARGQNTLSGTASFHRHPGLPKPEDLLHISDPAFDLDIYEDWDDDVVVNPTELPLPVEARRLFDLYTSTIHGAFPIVPKDTFEKKLRACYGPGHVTPREKAILNLIFAIASYRSDIAVDNVSVSGLGHRGYQARAQLLGLNNLNLIVVKPDMELIQLTGLLSLYYLSIGHASRAWLVIGIALRYALLLGLHLKDNGPYIDLGDKDTRAQTWWSLRAIEFRLSALTARPSVISDRYCTILPLLAAQEWASADANASRTPGKLPSQAAFLAARLKIGYLTQKVMTKLYSPRTASKPWEKVQQIISSLKRELDAWGAIVLGGHALSAMSLPSSARYERVDLEFYYCSTVILLTRPCLHRHEQRVDTKAGPVRDFNEKTAEQCFQAAKRIATLLPDQANPASVYEVCPWWSIVHFTTQALTVFLQVLTYDGEGRWTPEFTNCTNKLISWLRIMRTNNPVADKAYKVIIQTLERGAESGNPFMLNLLGMEQTNQAFFQDMQELDLSYDPVPQNEYVPFGHQDPAVGFSGFDNWGADLPPMDTQYLMDAAFDPSNDPNRSSPGLTLDPATGQLNTIPARSSPVSLHPLPGQGQMSVSSSAPYLQDPDDETPTKYP